jgi:hypothetical protein
VIAATLLHTPRPGEVIDTDCACPVADEAELVDGADSPVQR